MHGKISMYPTLKWESEAERPNGEIENHEKEYDEPASLGV